MKNNERSDGIAGSDEKSKNDTRLEKASHNTWRPSTIQSEAHVSGEKCSKKAEDLTDWYILDSSFTRESREDTSSSIYYLGIDEKNELICEKLDRSQAAADARNLHFPVIRVGCENCNVLGHLSRDCPFRRSVKCYLCSEQGHLGIKCPSMPCFHCFGEGHYPRDCGNKRFARLNCYRCGMKGHDRNNCPEAWRQFRCVINSPIEEKSIEKDDKRVRSRRATQKLSGQNAGQNLSAGQNSGQNLLNIQNPLLQRANVFAHASQADTEALRNLVNDAYLQYPYASNLGALMMCNGKPMDTSSAQTNPVWVRSDDKTPGLMLPALNQLFDFHQVPNFAPQK